jgi:hypothetical protein
VRAYWVYLGQCVFEKRKSFNERGVEEWVILNSKHFFHNFSNFLDNETKILQFVRSLTKSQIFQFIWWLKRSNIKICWMIEQNNTLQVLRWLNKSNIKLCHMTVEYLLPLQFSPYRHIGNFHIVSTPTVQSPPYIQPPS